MTQDDILRMARNAGCGWAQNGTEPVLMGAEQITRFAALVAAAEREACAKVCDEFGEEWMCDSHELAKIIRARGKE